MINDENKNISESNNSAADSGSQNNKTIKNQQANSGTGSDKGPAVEPVKNVVAQARESAGEMYEMVADKATEQIEGQKKNLSSGLVAIADSIRQAGDTLRDGEEQNAITGITADYGHTIADKIEQVSGYFDSKDLKGMVRDVETFARNQPAVFIGVAFAAGLLAARFLKSSSSPNGSASQSGSETVKRRANYKAQKANRSNEKKLTPA